MSADNVPYQLETQLALIRRDIEEIHDALLWRNSNKRSLDFSTNDLMEFCPRFHSPIGIGIATLLSTRDI
jgi:hypothetical protein